MKKKKENNNNDTNHKNHYCVNCILNSSRWAKVVNTRPFMFLQTLPNAQRASSSLLLTIRVTVMATSHVAICRSEITTRTTCSFQI